MYNDVVLAPGISIRSLVNGRPRTSVVEDHDAGAPSSERGAPDGETKGETNAATQRP